MSEWSKLEAVSVGGGEYRLVATEDTFTFEEGRWPHHYAVTKKLYNTGLSEKKAHDRQKEIAERFVLCWNAHDSLLQERDALVAALREAATHANVGVDPPDEMLERWQAILSRTRTETEKQEGQDDA